VLAFEPRSAHPVAVFEVADAAFGAGSVAAEPPLGFLELVVGARR